MVASCPRRSDLVHRSTAGSRGAPKGVLPEVRPLLRTTNVGSDEESFRSRNHQLLQPVVVASMSSLTGITELVAVARVMGSAFCLAARAGGGERHTWSEFSLLSILAFN